jgi:hypothetical protein
VQNLLCCLHEECRASTSITPQMTQSIAGFRLDISSKAELLVPVEILIDPELSDDDEARRLTVTSPVKSDSDGIES